MSRRASIKQVPMRREPAFSRGGAYHFTLEKNLGFHREAIATGIQILAKHFSRRLQNKKPPKNKKLPPNKKPLYVLDLACGGRPVATAAMMARFAPQTFEYTGVDINPDQVASCLQFDFPKNVTAKKILEGNAWDLDSLPLKGKFDIVFIGLNTHHGSPEEIFSLVRRIFARLNAGGSRGLAAGGIFLNHDLFRPEKYPYVRKPAAGQVAAKKDWRDEWLTGYQAFVRQTGATEEMIAQGNQHMREWDYPLSMKELCDILKKTGFHTTQHSYTSKTNPFAHFYGMVAGRVK